MILLVFINRYHTVQSAIMRIDRYAEMISKRKNKVINAERMVRMSWTNLEESKNQLVRLITDYTEHLKPSVDAYFKSIEGKERSEIIRTTAKELRMVNVYFFYFFLRLGHRLCMFEQFPIDRCPSLSCPLDSLPPPLGGKPTTVGLPPGGKLSQDILHPTLVIFSPGGYAVLASLSCPPPNTSKNKYMLFCYFSVSF